MHISNALCLRNDRCVHDIPGSNADCPEWQPRITQYLCAGGQLPRTFNPGQNINGILGSRHEPLYVLIDAIP